MDAKVIYCIEYQDIDTAFVYFDTFEKAEASFEKYNMFGGHAILQRITSMPSKPDVLRTQLVEVLKGI